jgi:hypothetical protein
MEDFLPVVYKSHQIEHSLNVLMRMKFGKKAPVSYYMPFVVTS